MKKLISLLLAAMLLAALPLAAAATSTGEVSGTCGEGLTWTLSSHTLTISGNGKMEDSCPWEEYKDDIRSLVLTGGVTYIGEEAFYGCEKLKTIDFGDSLQEIGAKAFYDCTRLTQIHLPSTFRSFGAECFRGCENLTKVYCDGGMPHFSDSCLWTGSYVNVYHPVNNPWPSEYVSVLMDNFGGRLLVLAAGTEVLDETEAVGETEETEETVGETAAETVAETAAATEAVATVPETTAPPATEAPTEAPTTVPTEAPTEAPTTVPTEAPTIAPEATQAPTQETEPAAATTLNGKGWIGLALIGGVLAFLVLGALIFRHTSHGGKYS